MSDEFLRVARQEIRGELAKIGSIFAGCSSDMHVKNNAAVLESHVHKIKGLAPMMGHNNLGELASISDEILKHMYKKDTFPDCYAILSDAFSKMQTLFSNGDTSIDIRNYIITTRKKIADVTKT